MMADKLVDMSNRVKLSAPAVTALIDTHDREGATVFAAPLVLAELSAVGYVGPRGGLTRSGWIRRSRETEAQFAELF